MWLPYALSYGCSYELFWHLNPRKLEPFRKKREIEAKQWYDDLDILAWRIGYYDAQAMGLWWGKNNTYPESPLGRSEDDGRVPPPGKGGPMSDGAKFAAFAVAHRKTIAGRKKRAEITGIG